MAKQDVLIIDFDSKYDTDVVVEVYCSISRADQIPKMGQPLDEVLKICTQAGWHFREMNSARAHFYSGNPDSAYTRTIIFVRPVEEDLPI